ncbi:MAG: hypothetical protein RR406_00090 [Bacilli bacterium]
MKTLFKIENIEVRDIKIGNITLEQEYTATDAIQLLTAGKDFVKTLVKELPEMLEDLEKAFNKAIEIDERIENSKQETDETFSYVYNNNINSIKQLLETRDIENALEIIKTTDDMCDRAYHHKEIDIKTLHECKHELRHLMAINAFSF